MPIYSYLCEACHTTTEILAKISDPPPSTCKNCGQSGQLKKQISRTAFQLKGDGWYSSGYEGKSNRAESVNSSSSSSKTESSTSD